MAEHAWIPKTESGDLEVEREEWPSFVESFSRQHAGWHVRVEKLTPIGRLVQIEEQPLKSVIFDRADEAQRVTIIVGNRDRNFIQSVSAPARIVLKRSAAGAHQGVDLASADGSITRIRFRAAVLPETLDGIAA